MTEKLIEEFLEASKEENYSKEDLSSFKKAIEFIKEKIGENKREGKEPVVNHNIRIANYLVKSNLSKKIILSGILYKSNHFCEEEKIKEDWGEEINSLILGQTEFNKLKEKTKNNETKVQREILLSSIKDLRIILVKLASKIDNLKNSKLLGEKEKKRIATEALELYVPIANRLGMDKLKKEITENAFKILHPKKYSEIQKFLKESERERQDRIKKIIDEFQKLLKGETKILKIKGREKSIYSIYKKMVERGKALDEQKDHYAIRIITENKENCYGALGKINEEYKIDNNTLKDYIKSPKENGYQSIHLVVNSKGGELVEIQIRTLEMDEIAEEGQAAHWAYKKLDSTKNFESKTAWLREIFLLKEKNELLNETKLNLFEDKIFCYTPKGKAFELKKGSTILDFAYKIHAEIGNKAIGGEINKKFSPLNTELKNGDVVKIITNKFQRPRREWIKFVKTSHAKNIIAKMVKKYEKIPVSKKMGLKEKENKEKEQILVQVPEFKNHIASFAKCCNPLPGEKILGILRTYKRVLVHNKNCERIKESKKNRVYAVWEESFKNPVKIHLLSTNRPGILSETLNTITRQRFKVIEASGKLSGNEDAECFFLIKLDTLKEFENVIESIKKLKGIKKIWVE